MTPIKESVGLFLEKQSSCIERVLEDRPILVKIIDTLLNARDSGNSVYTMGNGGSGSTASHFASDLLKTSMTNGTRRFAAISLVDNIPVVLAWANDVSYDYVFVEQLKNFLNPRDVVVGFSGSGKSKNVVGAFQYAKTKGASCIGITGMSGGDFLRVSDICLKVPSDDMLIIESVHLAICHCIVDAIRKTGKPVFAYVQKNIAE